MKKYLRSLVVSILFVVMVYGFYVSRGESREPHVTPGGERIYVMRTKEGYIPKDIIIQKGDVVIWQNKADEFHWPASDIHPTHGVYPEFDPRRPVAVDEEWEFQFLNTGTWKYHDHIRAYKTGTITVIE